MKTKIIYSIMALVLAGGVAWISVSEVSAQSSTPQTIIQKIAAKFGLKETEVQTVFETERTARQAEMQKRFEERLAQAVKDGKITEAQKTAILAKHKEMQQNREQNRSEWQTWLKANGLENADLGLGMGLGGGMGKGMGMGRGMHSW